MKVPGRIGATVPRAMDAASFVLTLIGSLVFGSISPTFAADLTFPAPDTDSLQVSSGAIPLSQELDPAFYHQPQGRLAAAKPGQILAWRKVTLANVGIIPMNVDAWQLAYRSNNSRNEPISAVATVLKPKDRSFAEPRHLLSLQIPENSTAGYCAPSYALQFLSASLLAGQILVPTQSRYIQSALDRGWAVMVPDDEGPNSAFGAGPLGARIILDGLRAATHFEPLQATPDSRIGLAGYSGGAISNGHAAELAQSYAPELHIVGVAEGGVAWDLERAVKVANYQPTTGIVLAAVIGATREYPDAQAYIYQKMNPAFRAVMDFKAPLCVSWQTVVFPFLDVSNNLGLDDSPVIQDFFADTRMGKATPSMPLFLWNSKYDEFFPIEMAEDLVDLYCKVPDARVEFVRDEVPEHIAAGLDGGMAGIDWLADRFAGKRAKQGCIRRDVPSLELDRSAANLRP